MLKPRWRKVLADLRNNPTRTVLVVFSIAVGIFAIGVIISSQAILARDLDAGYRAIHPASAMLITEPFDEDLVQVVRRMPAVGEAEGRRTINARLQIGPDEWRDIIFVAIDDYNAMRVNQVQPDRGAWPPPEHAMLIERSGLPFAHATVGDTVLIRMPDLTEREVRIAGLAHDLSREPAFLESTVYGYITFETLEWLGQPHDFNELHFTVAENANDQSHVQYVAEQVSDKVEKSGRAVLTRSVPEPFKYPLDDILQALLLILGILGVLSLFLSGFLVINTISAILMQQIRQIGVMKAIGARRKQIMGMYVVMVLIFGLIALGIAIPLGAVGTRFLTTFLADLFNFDLLSFNPPLYALLIQLVVGLLVPILAALYPIMSGTRMTVRAAISSYGVEAGQFGKGLIDRLVGRVRGLSRPLLISLRNTFRRKGRLLLTLATMALGGAIFISVLSVRASLFLTLDEIMQFWRFDVWVLFEHPYRREKVEAIPLQVPEVVAAEGWGLDYVRRIRADDSESETIILYAPPATTSMIDPVILAGRWLLPEDENAIVVSAQVIRLEPDIAIGDAIEFKIDGRELTWYVVGISRAQEPVAYVNYPHYARAVRRAGQADMLAVVTRQHDEAAQSAAAKALDATFTRTGPHVSSILTLAGERAEGANAFNIIVVLLTIMSMLLALVGGLGLAGTMSINVLERTREIGIIRAIGASDREILKIVITEGVFISLLSWLIGTVCAIPLSRLFSDAVGIAFLNAPLSYTFSTHGVLLWLGLVVVLAVLASVLPAWNAARMTVRDALAYE